MKKNRKILKEWLLVLGLKEGLVGCATSCIKSEVILMYLAKKVQKRAKGQKIPERPKKAKTSCPNPNSTFIKEWN